MYCNKKHKKTVKDRKDGYEYIGSYKTKEITIDDKNKKGNAIYIRIKCLYCGSEYDVQLIHFKNGTNCTNCCNKYENSFAYYIQQELKEPLSKYWDWEKNELNPYLISKKNDKKIWIKCAKTDYHNSYPTTPSRFHQGDRCPYCTHTSGKVHPKDSFAQWGIDTFGEDFLNKYWSPKNTLNPWKIAPQSSNKIWILCQEKDYHNDDGGYKVACDNFYRGNRCPYCIHRRGYLHPKDSFGYLYPQKAKYWSKSNTKSPFEVAPYSKTEYKFYCEKCKKGFRKSLQSLNSSNIGVICNNCNGSKLEQKNKLLLMKYNINYKREKTFNGLIGVGGNPLRFDFYLPDKKIAIEDNGKQHKEYIEGMMSYDQYLTLLEHDKRKIKYCKQHGIKLITIWYDEIDKMEDILIKELGLKYIKE